MGYESQVKFMWTEAKCRPGCELQQELERFCLYTMRSVGAGTEVEPRNKEAYWFVMSISLVLFQEMVPGLIFQNITRHCQQFDISTEG